MVGTAAKTVGALATSATQAVAMSEAESGFMRHLKCKKTIHQHSAKSFAVRGYKSVSVN
jgi:hypothetical protein